MKSVVVFGTFDLFHPGHAYVLRQARKHGRVTVIIARDETVTKLKGRSPLENEQTRQKQVAARPEVHEAILGDLQNHMAFLDHVTPDVICLGYDQKFNVEKLNQELATRNLQPEIIRLKPYRQHQYKTSLLRAKRPT